MWNASPKKWFQKYGEFQILVYNSYIYQYVKTYNAPRIQFRGGIFQILIYMLEDSF